MKYTKEKLQPIVETSTSLAQVIKSLGLKITGGNYVNIKKRIHDAGLDTSHFVGQAHQKGRPARNKMHWSEVLIRTTHGRRT